MAIIQRPPKQGGIATTYQDKVAQGYTKILAVEVDADFDTIYAAWNGGVDTVNIVGGSITGDKLAPGAVTSREILDGSIQTVDIGNLQVTTGKLADGAVTFAKLDPTLQTAGGDLVGLYPNPTIGVIAGNTLHFAARMLLWAGPTNADVWANHSGADGYDSSKGAWITRMDYANNTWELWYAAPGATQTFGRQVYLTGATGRLTAFLADNVVSRGMVSVGTLIGNSVSSPSPVSFGQPSPGVWTPIVTLPTLTVRGPTGGNVGVWLHANPGISCYTTGGGSTINQRIIRGTTQVVASPYFVVTPNRVPLPGFSWFDVVPSGTAISYQYQLLCADSQTFVIGSSDGSGGIQAVEFG